MVGSQEIEILESRYESVFSQTLSAQKYLLEMVAKYGLDGTDVLWFQKPSDSAGTQQFPLTHDEALAIEAMSTTEKIAWFERRLGQHEAKRKEKQELLPSEVRAALVRLNELGDMQCQIATDLATKMYQRGLIGLIADRLKLQEDSEVEEYLDIPKNP
jgi:hypothetical protein